MARGELRGDFVPALTSEQWRWNRTRTSEFVQAMAATCVTMPTIVIVDEGLDFVVTVSEGGRP